jgi:hypothetical protein
MKYRWTRCPKCDCEVAINFTDSPRGISGSLRRWSADRSINDGRPIRLARSEMPADGGFVIACVCGQELTVPAKPDAVSAEREGDLRVDLGKL